MGKIISYSEEKISSVEIKFKRYLFDEIDSNINRNMISKCYVKELKNISAT